MAKVPSVGQPAVSRAARPKSPEYINSLNKFRDSLIVYRDNTTGANLDKCRASLAGLLQSDDCIVIAEKRIEQHNLRNLLDAGDVMNDVYSKLSDENVIARLCSTTRPSQIGGFIAQSIRNHVVDIVRKEKPNKRIPLTGLARSSRFKISVKPSLNIDFLDLSDWENETRATGTQGERLELISAAKIALPEADLSRLQREVIGGVAAKALHAYDGIVIARELEDRGEITPAKTDELILEFDRRLNGLKLRAKHEMRRIVNYNNGSRIMKRARRNLAGQIAKKLPDNRALKTFTV